MVFFMYPATVLHTHHHIITIHKILSFTSVLIKQHGSYAILGMKGLC